MNEREVYFRCSLEYFSEHRFAIAANFDVIDIDMPNGGYASMGRFGNILLKIVDVIAIEEEYEC